MRSFDHPVEITKRSGDQAAGRNTRLRGFFNPQAESSEPVLIKGDEEKFAKDLQRYKRKNITTGSASRWWIENHVY